MSAKHFLYYSIASSIFLAILILNALTWHESLLGVFLLVFFLLFYGRVLVRGIPLPFCIAGILAAMSLYGALFYYTAALTQTVTLLGIGVFILLLPFFVSKSTSEKTLLPKFPTFLSTIPFWLVATLLFSGAFFLLVQTEILTPVRSPWLVVPSIFFLCLFLFALLTTASRSRLLFVALFFLTISIALLVYPLGYGFDSFIHQATEQHIADYGTITPKPFYYVGQYALVLFATHAFQIPVAVADTFLLPLLATLLLAPIVLSTFRSRFAALSLFLLPLATFIVTTPQGLANFWALLVILSTIRSRPNYLPILFTFAALVTHPLSGIPLVLFLVLRWLSNKTPTSRSWSYCFRGMLGASCVALPIVFLVNSLVSGQPIAFHPERLFNAPIADLFHLSFFFSNRFDVWKDAAYLVGWNQTILILLLAIGGFILARRQGLRALRIYGIMSVVLLVNFFLLSRLFEFSFLIEYERSNYAERLFQLAIFFALPLLALSLEELERRLLTKPVVLRAGAYGLTALVLTATVYLTYPRHDNYEISRGFNVGTSDFATVEYIHTQKEPGTYVVLANQAVSAAALKTFGFETYFNGDIFYYPIPTGGELYERYLEMVNQGPTSERATKAMDLAGVDTVYFVVNDYWYLSEKIIENAKREAADWVAIDSGATYVFEFQR